MGENSPLQETREIYGKIAELLSRGEEFAVATIVRTDGSTPRNVGTKMIILRDGSIHGTIGGGTVEKTVISEALKAIKDGKPRLLTFRLEREEDGMICGGNMDIYVEPVTLGYDILIIGGGHVGRALARLASAMGFPVTLIDPAAKMEDYPEETKIIAKDCVEGLAEAEVTPRTCIVIATGSHESDEAALRKALETNAYYIGMLGSRRKVSTIFRRLGEQGVSEEKLKRVNAPIGLDIGAETPSEIAVSILAEIISKIKGGTGKPLKASSG